MHGFHLFGYYYCMVYGKTRKGFGGFLCETARNHPNLYEGKPALSTRGTRNDAKLHKAGLVEL